MHLLNINLSPNMKVAIIKYNAGNLFSVNYALKRLGVEAVITANKEELLHADKIIFPGVGEAETTMNHLRKQGLDKLICELRQPVLGICLGMQLLCRHSEEGNVDCLGVFDADVKRFTPQYHEEKCLTWDGIRLRTPQAACFKALQRKNLFTLFTVIMFQSTNLQVP